MVWNELIGINEKDSHKLWEPQYSHFYGYKLILAPKLWVLLNKVVALKE